MPEANDDRALEEALRIMLDGVPEVVRNFILSPERRQVSLRLSQRYGLHVDQAGTFENSYIYLLLGVNAPDEFVRDLQKAGIPMNTIRSLTNDLNEEVFKRLQQKELHEEPRPVAPRPSGPLVPVPSIAAAPEKPIAPVTPAASETPLFNLVKPTAPPVVSTAVRPSIPPVAPAPVMRTMQHDMELVQHGSQPSAYPAPSLHPAQATPARMFQTASVPVTAPTQPQPVREMVHLVPDKPVSTALPPPQSSPVIDVAPAKEYASDPYREAI